MLEIATPKLNRGPFEIVSYRIQETGPTIYVIYCIQVKHPSTVQDPTPSTIERRYTDFLNLYQDLRNEFPTQITGVQFPKKVFRGNFTSSLIHERIKKFEKLLEHIYADVKLRTSRVLANFLQGAEMKIIRELIEEKKFFEVTKMLEQLFILLNKVFTDRSPPVLFALCRLVASSVMVPDQKMTQKYAELALQRYNGVSDSDLLELYVPLLETCMKSRIGTEKSDLERKLKDLRNLGMKSDETLNFFNQVDILEKKIFM